MEEVGRLLGRPVAEQMATRVARAFDRNSAAEVAACVYEHFARVCETLGRLGAKRLRFDALQVLRRLLLLLLPVESLRATREAPLSLRGTTLLAFEAGDLHVEGVISQSSEIKDLGLVIRTAD